MNFPELSDITPAKVAALKERIAARERAGKTAEETEAKDEDEKDGSAE